MTTTTSIGIEKPVVDERELKVLIVDDDPMIRRLHVALIREFRVMASTAGNGEEAVNLHRNGASFNLVLMDKEMPVMDGLSATKELRAMGVTSMIVGVTSLADEDDQKKAFMEAGLNQCFGKPLTVDRVTSLLNQLEKDL